MPKNRTRRRRRISLKITRQGDSFWSNGSWK